MAVPARGIDGQDASGRGGAGWRGSSPRCWMHKTGNVLNYFPKSRRIAGAMRWRRRSRACTRSGWPRRAPRPARLRQLDRTLRGEIPQGDRLPGPRPRGTPRLLQLPRGALDAPAHDQRDRVGVRHHPPSEFAGEGLRDAPGHALDDLQDGHERGAVVAPTTRLPAAENWTRFRARVHCEGCGYLTPDRLQRVHDGDIGANDRCTTWATFLRPRRPWTKRVADFGPATTNWRFADTVLLDLFR